MYECLARYWPEAYYGEDLTARAYVSYVDSNDQPQEIYTSTATRSLAYVAGASVKASVGVDETHEDYLDETEVSFLNEIVDKVVELLEIDNVKEDVSYELYKYIKQNFLKVKNNEVAENIELEEFKISSKTIDGECVINIERK